MNGTTRAVTAPLALLLAFAACSSPPDEEAAPDTAAGPAANAESLLRTDTTAYPADTARGEVAVRIAVTLTNTTDDSVFVSTCGANTPMYVVERLSGTEYTVALRPMCPAIATPPIAVAPGASRTDTLSIRAAVQRPGQPPVSAPVLEAERVAGTYRLVYEIFGSGWDATGAPDQATRLSVDARTSNRFELR